MDRIEINGLRTMTLIGALAHEREIRQPLQIDLALEVDLGDAGRSDDLGDTVDYGMVAALAHELASENSCILLERLALSICERILAVDRVDAVEVALTKLHMPIAVDVADTGVRIRRTVRDLPEIDGSGHCAYLALGSNLGDRPGYLRTAVDGVGQIVSASDVYETAPVGGPANQGSYLNMVIEVRTELDPFALLRRCQRVEAAAMRERVVRWGPRTLDIDILFYDDVSITSSDLTIPHPRFSDRSFVLAPLSDIAPQLCPSDWAVGALADGVVSLGSLDSLRAER